MTKPQLTRIVVKQLRDAGFHPTRHRGSHTVWEHPTGITIAIADGHRETSAGVYSQVLDAINQTKKK